MKVYLVVLSSFFLLSHRCTAEGVDEADHSLRGTHQKKRTMNRQLVTLTDTILRLELIDSSKQTTVAVLTDGLSVPATSTLNVNAVVSNSVINDIKSVKFSLDTVANFRIENGAPFALCGEDKGVYRSCGHYLGVGTHTITAVPFGSTGGTGAMGAAKTLTFTIAAAATTTAAAIPSTPKPTTAPTTTAPIPSAPKPTAPSSAVPIPSPPTPTAPIPTALTTCKVPKFVGTWSGRNPKYPIHVAEAQGAMIGNTMFLVSGFSVNYQTTTTRCYAMDTTASRIVWQRMDDLPGTVGTTHAPSVVIGTKFYMCGGYVGGHPGPQSDKCFVYDNSVAPGNAKQWSSFLSLPDGRGGGGMVYDTKRNSLIFASGAKRPQAGNAFAVDYNNTWMYSFADPSAGWVPKASIPFVANHMSSVTAIDGTGNEHHFFMGGQNSEIECCGNHKEIYEFDAENETWIRRADMPVTRGHAASSTRPISCGFLIAAGTTNEYGKTADVSYYNIPTDAWTSIGNLTNALNTPVCDLKGGYLYCESGWVNVGFSYRRQITV